MNDFLHIFVRRTTRGKTLNAKTYMNAQMCNTEDISSKKKKKSPANKFAISLSICIHKLMHQHFK